MNYSLGTQFEPCTLVISFRSLKSCTVKIKIVDREKAYTVLIDHDTLCYAGRDETVYCQMPLTPREVLISIYDEQTGNRSPDQETNFKILQIKKASLPTNIHVVNMAKGGVANFVDFAQRFCYNAGVLPINKPGKYYKSHDAMFKLTYLDRFVDNPVTPARVSVADGIFQASREKMIHMTVPGRMVIMCHEYAHQNENEDPDWELEADLNGLEIYLGLGFPRYEAVKAYGDLFYKAASAENMKRMAHVEQFVKKFDLYL